MPRKKAPAAERAKQFGARGLPARCTSAASLSHLTRLPCTLPARCTSAASLSHLTRLPCTRVEGVERPRRRGAGQARMELHGVSALSECRAVLWNGRGRWGQPRWLHAPPIHNVSLYYHRFFLHTCKTLTKNCAPPLGSASSPRLRLDTLLSRLSSPQSERNVPQNLRRSRCAVAGVQVSTCESKYTLHVSKSNTLPGSRRGRSAGAHGSPGEAAAPRASSRREPAGRTLVFDMDRDGRKTLGAMKETVGKQSYNPDFNKHYDTHVHPVVTCLERRHGAPLEALARRRHLQRRLAAG